MRKVSRAEEQNTELNFRNVNEKTAYDWNMATEMARGLTHVVNEVRRGVDVAGHDTAGVGRSLTHGLGMAGHGLVDLGKNIGHGVADLFSRGRHDVAGVGHSVANEFDRARHDLAGAADSTINTVGGGEQGALHSVANEFDRARHDLAGAGDAVGGAIGDAAKAVGHGFTGAGDAAGGAVGDTGRAIGHGVAEVFDPARHDVAGVGHSIANEFNRVRHDVAGAGDAVGNAIGDAGKAVVNKLDPIADKENQLSKNPLNALYPLGLGLGLAGGTMLHHQRQVNKIKKDMELKKQQQAESEGIDKKSSFDERYAFEKTAIVAPVNLGDAIQQGTSVAQDIIGGLGLALPTLGVGKAVKTVVDKVKRNKAIDDRDLAERKEMWRLYGPIHWGDMIEQHGPAADPSHPEHDLNNQYIRQFSRTSLPSFKPRTRRASAKTAGAWPSNTDWETHLKSLETLLGEVQKGVGWHAAMEQDKEMKAHDKAGKAIQEAIDATRRIMQFPDAGKDK